MGGESERESSQMGGILKKVPAVNGGESPAVADPRSTSTGDGGGGGGHGASPATATPITPSSFSSRFVNVVSLYDWWLTKIKGGDGVFRLGVGGFSTKGQHAPRLFLSAPIVRRRDSFTLESEDNNTILIHNLVNRQRTLDNGFSPEACDFFLMGFPYNWKVRAEQYCGEPKPTSNPIITPCSGNPSKSSAVNSGQVPSFNWDEFPIRRVRDILNSTPGTPDDQLRKSILSEIMRTFSVHSSRRATSGGPVDVENSAKCWRPITRSMSKHVMTGTSKEQENKTTDMNKFSSETMVSSEPKETKSSALHAGENGIGECGDSLLSVQPDKSSALHAGEDGIGECGDSLLSVQPDNHYHACGDSLLPIPSDNHNHTGISKPGSVDSGEHCFLETSNPCNNFSHDFMFQEKTEMIKLPEPMTILQNEDKLSSAKGKLKENNTVGHGPADSEALTDEDIGVARKLNFLSSPSPIKGNQKLIIGRDYRATAIKRGKNCIGPSIENETTEEIQNETTEEILLNNSVQAEPSNDKASSKLLRRKQKSSPFVQLNQSPITRERAKELSCVTPESLNCKRSRSGRLLVPRLDPGLNQRLIYDMEGTVTGIKTCADVPVSPWKGPRSKPHKRRK